MIVLTMGDLPAESKDRAPGAQVGDAERDLAAAQLLFSARLAHLGARVAIALAFVAAGGALAIGALPLLASPPLVAVVVPLLLVAFVVIVFGFFIFWTAVELGQDLEHGARALSKNAGMGEATAALVIGPDQEGLTLIQQVLAWLRPRRRATGGRRANPGQLGRRQ